MDNADIGAMVGWIGALLRDDRGDDEAGASHAVAGAILGADAVAALRAHFAGQPPDQAERERVGAVLACIWIAQADRVVVDEERDMLRAVVREAGIAPWRQAELLAAVEEPIELAAITTELTHPSLRELVLALGWQIAASDSEVAPEEQAALAEMAGAFGIDEARVASLRGALG